MSAKNKYTFTLFINSNDIDSRYGFIVKSNIGKNLKQPSLTTKLTELAPVNSTDIISFFDEAKTMHKCNVSMIDFSSNKSPCEFNPEKYCCFWDKCPCPKNITPIGCPIRYISNQIKKNYLSEISRDNYTIIENITDGRKKYLEDNDAFSEHLILKPNAYYETDGVFCSWNCAMSFAEDNKNNSLYQMSITLLLKMYNDFNNTYNIIITPAPHWRLLNVFGGNQTIEEFRNAFSKIDYENHGFVKSFRPLAMMIEEKIKF